MSNNSAQFYGGSTYILFNGNGAHVANVIDTIFESNYAKDGGAGMVIVGTDGLQESPHVFYIKKCAFNSNRAEVGAGIYYSINLGGKRTNIIHFANCSFIGNSLSDDTNGFGAGLAVDFSNIPLEKQSFPLNTLSDWYVSECQNI